MLQLRVLQQKGQQQQQPGAASTPAAFWQRQKEVVVYRSGRRPTIVEYTRLGMGVDPFQTLNKMSSLFEHPLKQSRKHFLEIVCHHLIYLVLEYVHVQHLISDFSTREANWMIALDRHIPSMENEPVLGCVLIRSFFFRLKLWKHAGKLDFRLYPYLFVQVRTL